MRTLRVAHSPDSDDAFMYWGIASGAVKAEGIAFEQALSDIESANSAASEGTFDLTAISVGAYPWLADRYLLLDSGASFGDGYGPIVVARQSISLDELAETEIVTPGSLTTASRVLRLALGDGVRTRDVAFDDVLDEVVSGRAHAGLLIHEGQLTYADSGLNKLLDLGVWWRDQTGLPLPLGLVAVRRDVDRVDDVSAVLRDAIDVALVNREEALEYARAFGRGIDAGTADEFVELYVNDLTLDMGERGRAAITRLLGHEPELVSP
jgi:1,4-dihydroxy-6-naphthoate synthase